MVGIVSNSRGPVERRRGLPAIPKPPSLLRREPEPDTTEVVALAIGTHPNLPSADDPSDKLRELEGKLDRCLQTLQMNFQPIVHAGTRKRFGYEALLRSNDKSLPHPGAILDAAERLERIPALGRAVRAQIAKVLAAAPPERGVVFVNLHLLDVFDLRKPVTPFAPAVKRSQFNKAVDAAAKANQVQPPRIDANTNKELNKEIDELIDSFMSQVVSAAFTVKAKLAKVDQDYRESRWNAAVASADGGITSQSPNGTWSELQGRKVGASLAAALPICTQSQLIA